MSEQINDGGPAFPELDRSEIYSSRDGGQNITHYSMGGMSLRDYFATHATEEDIRDAIASAHYVGKSISRQQARFYHAEFMLAAREIKK